MVVAKEDSDHWATGQGCSDLIQHSVSMVLLAVAEQKH